MSKETNRLLGHADEADGIEEYDNPLPDWWVGLFWFTIVWAVGYGLWYHVIAHRSEVKQLQEEMAAAEVRWPAQAPVTAAEFTITPDEVTRGAEVFTKNCVPCHGADMKGVIGPSLIDDEWIHGGQAAEILHTIANGVLDKGMPPWGTMLPPEQVRDVAAYVITKNSEATGRPIAAIMAPPDTAGGGGGAAADSAGGSGAGAGNAGATTPPNGEA
jgi:cytochrome c oxidase cbb3-type subunit 3